MNRTRMHPLLRMAAIAGSATAVAMHLRRGALPNSRDGGGSTALMLAAARGRLAVCKVLLERGADPALVDISGRNALAVATEAGHGEIANLLASLVSGNQTLDETSNADTGLTAEGDASDLWEVQTDLAPQADDGATLAGAAAVQMRIAGHQATSGDQDWSDVLIDIPASGRSRTSRSSRARGSVLFRRLKDSGTPGVPRAARMARANGVSLPELEEAMVALDLSRGPDEILETTTLAQIVRGADASLELRRCLTRSDLFAMSAAEFLADADGEARFCQAQGIDVDDYLELADVINAFTVLVHREANHDQLRQAVRDGARTGPLIAAPANEPDVPFPDPDEVLRTTTLAQLVLNAASSTLLRKALRHNELFSMSATDFLLDDDAERKFCEQGKMDLKTYLELDHLVNAYTLVLHHNTRRSRGMQPA